MAAPSWNRAPRRPDGQRQPRDRPFVPARRRRKVGNVSAFLLPRQAPKSAVRIVAILPESEPTIANAVTAAVATGIATAKSSAATIPSSSAKRKTNAARPATTNVADRRAVVIPPVVRLRMAPQPAAKNPRRSAAQTTPASQRAAAAPMPNAPAARVASITSAHPTEATALVEPQAAMTVSVPAARRTPGTATTAMGARLISATTMARARIRSTAPRILVARTTTHAPRTSAMKKPASAHIRSIAHRIPAASTIRTDHPVTLTTANAMCHAPTRVKVARKLLAVTRLRDVTAFRNSVRFARTVLGTTFRVSTLPCVP